MFYLFTSKIKNIVPSLHEKLVPSSKSDFSGSKLIEAAMDGECFKSDSDFPPNKCPTRLDGGVDRISELPDEIKVVILSFLSLREAAATSVLSARWSDLWKHTPILDFNTDILNFNTQIPDNLWDVKSCKYVELVTSILQSHKALSLKKFRISLYVDKSGKSAVTKWLEFVFSRQVERLELDFRCCEKRYKVVLEELLKESRICQPQTLIFFNSLKRLRLQCFEVSGEAIELFLSNCPLLEQLMIRSATLTSNVDVCGATLKLQCLEILDCKGKKSIKVSAPNLTYIRFYETSVKLLLENVPKLVEADFRIVSLEFVVQHFASAASCCISQLQILVLILYRPKVILANGYPEMPNLKELVVFYRGVYDQTLLPVTALIWASPRIQKFKLLFVGVPNKITVHMDVTTNVERSPHRHLKVCEFGRTCGDNSDHIIELVMYILNNCVALRNIIIGRPHRGSSAIRGEEQADRDYLKQQLGDKLPRHIQLQVYDPL